MRRRTEDVNPMHDHQKDAKPVYRGVEARAEALHALGHAKPKGKIRFNWVKPAATLSCFWVTMLSNETTRRDAQRRDVTLWGIISALG
jgi:hypothetical protein